MQDVPVPRWVGTPLVKPTSSQINNNKQWQTTTNNASPPSPHPLLTSPSQTFTTTLWKWWRKGRSCCTFLWKVTIIILLITTLTTCLDTYISVCEMCHNHSTHQCVRCCIDYCSSEPAKTFILLPGILQKIRFLDYQCLKQTQRTQRSLSFQGPSTWNMPPHGVRHASTSTTLKSLLKTQLFKQ